MREMPSESEILNVLRSQSGLKGREIAARLNADKAEVNSMLWRLQNRGLARQDNAYRWFAVEKTAATPTQRQQEAPKQLTTLGRLCRYYLECLSLDDEAGVRVFARSQYALDYVELPEVPGFITDQPVTAFAGVDDLFRRLRNDRERKVPYIGYPVRLRKHRSANGWEGFFLEPVFMFGFNDEALRPGQTPVLGVPGQDRVLAEPKLGHQRLVSVNEGLALDSFQSRGVTSGALLREHAAW